MLNIEAAIREIQQGNRQLREDLLSSQKNFIHKYASFICKALLNWENDDELSIALIAFNKAINNYDPDADSKFLSYARVLMKNSLIDYFRHEERHNALPLIKENRGETYAPGEIAASWNSYLQEVENRDRAFEIDHFKDIIAQFGLTLDDLARNSPSHKDTRDNLKKIALKIAHDPEIMEDIYKNKKLPAKRIQLLTQTGSKILEKWRKYILSLLIILTQEETAGLVEYIWDSTVWDD
ncbi:MAG: sigma factor [Bacillota bacterium]|nr:sigma factor [Bacillota bacterium]